jgi:uncharacterized protein (DUF2147 family)
MAISENIHTPDTSGRAMADMVDGKDWAGVSGRYAEGRKIIPSSEESYDEAKARRLWEVSEALVGERKTGDETSPPGTDVEARGRRDGNGVAAVALAIAALTALAGHRPAMAQLQAESPVGVWRTYGDDGTHARGLVRIDENAGVLTGTLVGTLVPGEDIHRPCTKCPGALRNRPLLGLVFLTGLKRQGDSYDGGAIIDPETEQSYSASLRLEPGGQRLVVRGYVGLSLLGRSQSWERVR